jgi:glucuronate isomerase
MTEDITKRLRDLLSWENADEAILEIQILRQMVRDWEQTAKMLAMDLGSLEFAQEIYDDVSDGLYEKVRERIKSIE